MSLTQWVVDGTIAGLLRLLCRVYGDQLEKVPPRGPLILATNHVNFLEIPALHIHLRPRPVTGIAKTESWDKPVTRFLFDLWGAIPIRRGEPDRAALRQALGVLEEGYILVVAPEGTRSGHGCLQRGHPGIVMLALQSGAPVLPLVFYGGERFWQNLRRLRRTPFHVVVGNPFHVQTDGAKARRELRQQITDEIMYQLAALLPPAYRGVYANLDAATETYLHFTSPATSNFRNLED
jgi:1-acyl-sn-glycerol-3-phosphate acyltransferase